MTGLPEEEWIGAHRVLDFEASESSAPVPTPEDAVSRLQTFSLAQHFTRGGYPGSLFAPSNCRGKAFRESWLRNELPTLPADQRGENIDAGRFWSLLADLNGVGLNRLQQDLRLNNAVLSDALGRAEQRGITFQLPYWAPPGKQADTASLNYWRDTGLVTGRQIRDGVRPERVRTLDEKRWEGFVITTLAAVAGPVAVAKGFRIGVDEIDLVLEWPGAKPWAIEISASATKRLTPGNRRAIEVVQAERVIVVDAGPLGRDRRVGGEHPMRLIEAMREVSERRS